MYTKCFPTQFKKSCVVNVHVNVLLTAVDNIKKQWLWKIF